MVHLITRLYQNGDKSPQAQRQIPLLQSSSSSSSPLKSKPRLTLTQVITLLKKEKEQCVSGFIWTIMQIRQQMKLLLILEKCCIR